VSNWSENFISRGGRSGATRTDLFSKIWISFGLLRDFFWSASQKPKEEQKKPWRGVKGFQFLDQGRPAF